MNPSAYGAETTIEEPARRTPVVDDVEVLVVGGGSAGWHAAVAAARTGASTLLIERNGSLGGTVTNAMVQPFMTYHDPVGAPVVAGLWREMLTEVGRLGGSVGPIASHRGKPPWSKRPTLTPFEPDVLKLVAQELVLASGARLLLHTSVVSVLHEDNKVRGVVVENKSGRSAILAKCVVDATGDADVVALSGAEYVLGREKDGMTMPMTLYIKISGVNYAKLGDFIRKHPEEFRWYAFSDVGRDAPPEYESDPVSASGFLSAVKAARESGELRLGRETINILPCLLRGEAVLNCTRVSGLNPTSAQDLTEAEIEGRRQAMSVTRFVKGLPGFEESRLHSIAPTIGVRESRRLVGEYILTEDDVVDCVDFEDVIARGAYNVDIHNPDDARSTWREVSDSYAIPYRSLLPRRVDGLLAAGRCISATHEAAAALRVTPNVAAIGEAAGTAAALSVQQSVPPRHLDVALLQARLSANGAILARPSETVG